MRKKMLTFQKVLDVYTTCNKHFSYIRTSAVTLLLTCTRDTKFKRGIVSYCYILSSSQREANI